MPLETPRPKRHRRGANKSGRSQDKSVAIAGGTEPEEAEGEAENEPSILDTDDRDWDLLHVALDEISPNPFNKRHMGDLHEIADTLNEPAGLLEPVTVIHAELFAREYPRDADGLDTKYVLVFGERRWRAHALAHKNRIRAILRNDLAPTVRQEVIKENWHRKNPTAMEEARQFGRLNDDGFSVREIASSLGIRNHSHVSRRLDLRQLPEVVQSALDTVDPVVKITSARKLLELPDENQRIHAFKLMRDEKASVEEAMRSVLVETEQEHHPQTHQGADPELPDGVEVPSGVPEGTTRRDHPRSAEPSSNEGSEDDNAVTISSDKRARTPPSRQSHSSRVDSFAAERGLASKARESACIDLLSEELPNDDATEALISRALLTGNKLDHARTKAHAWLQQAGTASLYVAFASAYYQAVLSSKDVRLIRRVTFATALAAGELRASDRRRTSWDRHDHAYVTFLIDSIGYNPETSWEKSELGIREGSTHTPDLSDQEHL